MCICYRRKLSLLLNLWINNFIFNLTLLLDLLVLCQAPLLQGPNFLNFSLDSLQFCKFECVTRNRVNFELIFFLSSQFSYFGSFLLEFSFWSNFSHFWCFFCVIRHVHFLHENSLHVKLFLFHFLGHFIDILSVIFLKFLHLWVQYL